MSLSLFADGPRGMEHAEKPDAIAIHEAGHVVINAYYGLHVRVATIVANPDDGSLGHVLGARFPPKVREMLDLGFSEVIHAPRQRDYVLRAVTGILAGNAAQAKYLGVDVDALINFNSIYESEHPLEIDGVSIDRLLVHGTDTQKAFDCLSRLCAGDDEEASALYTWRDLIAHRLVRHETLWAQIESVAEALQTHGTLKPKQIAEAYRRADARIAAAFSAKPRAMS